MGWKPSYATICHNCGINWEEEFLGMSYDKKDLNYCIICGNELAAPKKGDMK